jgi:hypothetical protein
MPGAAELIRPTGAAGKWLLSITGYMDEIGMASIVLVTIGTKQVVVLGLVLLEPILFSLLLGRDMVYIS